MSTGPTPCPGCLEESCLGPGRCPRASPASAVPLAVTTDALAAKVAALSGALTEERRRRRELAGRVRRLEVAVAGVGAGEALQRRRRSPSARWDVVIAGIEEAGATLLEMDDVIAAGGYHERHRVWQLGPGATMNLRRWAGTALSARGWTKTQVRVASATTGIYAAPGRPPHAGSGAELLAALRAEQALRK